MFWHQEAVSIRSSMTTNEKLGCRSARTGPRWDRWTPGFHPRRRAYVKARQSHDLTRYRPMARIRRLHFSSCLSCHALLLSASSYRVPGKFSTPFLVPRRRVDSMDTLLGSVGSFGRVQAGTTRGFDDRICRSTPSPWIDLIDSSTIKERGSDFAAFAISNPRAVPGGRGCGAIAKWAGYKADIGYDESYSSVG